MGKKYQVLARKYRPQKFADVIGQEAVLTTIKNALRFDQAAHAYLFAGSRGVGKTTLARLFAKALNCPNRGADLEPCNECPSCFEVTSGQSLDVMEIDGASNRGIDDIRQINETVGYAPSHGKYKIYIIDEVHMLTKEAFNALLKTLEEPPERAKFFFATTEPHKVLPTIISRCQRFDLLRIGASQIADKLSLIALDMNRKAEPEALHLIASFADGSLRDAESLFDQILCFASASITADTVRQALGLIAQDHFFDLDQAFSECRLAYAFELVEHLFLSGKDLSHFLEQLVEHYRLLCLCKTLGEKSLPLHLRERYFLQMRHYTQAQCLYILDTLIAAEQTMQKSPFPRVTLESTLLHIIRSKNRIPIEVIAKRLSELESSIKSAPQESGVIPVERIAPPPPTIEKIKAPSIFSPPVELAPKEKLSEILSQPTPVEPIEKIKAPSVFSPPVELAPKEKLSEILSQPTPVEPIEKIKPPSVFDPAPKLATEEPPTAPSVFSPPIELASKEKPSENPIKPTPAETVAPIETIKPTQVEAPLKHSSHYDTLMRFAAVELEGTLKI